MLLEELTAAPELPVTRAALSAHLRLGEGFAEPSGEDDLLDRLIGAATRVVEARAGLALVTRRFRLSVSDWDRDGYLVLPVGPVVEIASATLGSMTLDGLAVTPGTTRQRLTRSGALLPPIPWGKAAVLEFDAGFGSAGAVPVDLREAVLLIAAQAYDDRTGRAPMPERLPLLLAPYRAVRI
ncbi:MAG: hypothetical protein ACFBRM_05205 [Pikeienuella sp.]